MAVAGANITALLTLNASGFKTGVETSIKAIKELESSFKRIGADAEVFQKGLTQVLRAVEQLSSAISSLADMTKEVKNFKTLAQGMNSAAEAAQRLTTVAQRGGAGIEALNSIINTWKAGMSSAELTTDALVGAMRKLAQQSTTTGSNITNSTSQASSSATSSFNNMVNGLNLLAQHITRTGTVISDTEARTKANLQISEQEFNKAREVIMQFANGGVQAFNKIDTSMNQARATFRSFNAEFIQRATQMREAMLSMDNATAKGRQNLALYHQNLRQLAMGVEQFNAIQTKSKSSTISYADNLARLNLAIQRHNGLTRYQAEALGTIDAQFKRNAQSVMQLITGENQHTVSLERNSEAMRKNGAEKLRAMGYTGQLSAEDTKETNAKNQNTNSTNRNTSAHQRNASAMSQSTARTNQLTSATSRLGKAMSSLRMVGSLVGSMLAYNFAHKLLVATGETIHAKSEMEGYFKMLHLGQDEVNEFNNALDQTVSRFQRVNKYSLGETISSIGVEFNLSTKEMIKAMDVTSMITSEYLRAGRNANEASLAVKDVLQGQFQRLSRETGVKGEQLKEAGWNGDVTDVESLLDALRKVGESRHWDVFAEKANSINDILTILQNRFGEWSAEMVNVVQPSIVNAFNAIMSVTGMFSNVLGGVWEWLNTDGWGQTAVKIGLVGTALLTVTQAMVMYRSGLGLVEASQLGLTKSIASLILGLKGQETAEIGVRNAILSKILGVKAETIAESGVTRAIQERLFTTKLETVEEKLNTASAQENTVAKKYLALQEKINTAEKEGLITVTEAEKLMTELETIETEANTIAKAENTGATTGLSGAIIALAGEENILAVATGEVSVAQGILNGVMAVSPVFWLIGGVMALAGAFYVLTGGLDEGWGKMQRANDAMQNATETLKPYQSYVETTNQELEEAKQKYGENSLVVQQLATRYENAKNSLEAYYKQLQSTTLEADTFNKELDEMSANLDAVTRENLGLSGFSNDEIDEMMSGIGDLAYAHNKYYHARQVLHKQEENFKNDSSSYIENLKKRQLSDEEYQKTLGDYTQTYNDLIYYSAKANSADNWWDYITNSAMAGLSGISLDWQEFWNNLFSGDMGLPEFIEGVFNGLDAISIPNTLAEIIGKSLGIEKGGGAKWLSGVFDGITKPLSDGWNGLTKWWDDNVVKGIHDLFSFDYVGAIGNGISDFFNGLFDFDWSLGLSDWWNSTLQGISDWASGIDIWGSIMDFLFPDPVSAEDGEGHLSVADEMYQVLIQPIVDWFNGFMADPLSYIGSYLVGMSPLGTLLSALLGSDGLDISWAWEWVNNNLIMPITTNIQMFMADPIAYIGDMGFSIAGLLDSLFGTDIFTNVMTWVNDSIITPFGTAIYNGIMQIPILSDILQLLGFTDQANGTSSDKGQMLAKSFGDRLQQVIGDIPILGDILRLLGIIDSQQSNAQTKGETFGEAIYNGVTTRVGKVAGEVAKEMSDVVNAITGAIQGAFNAAQQVGQAIWNGINSVLQRASPGFIHDQVLAEFGTDIPNAIQSSGEMAYSVAQSYGQNISDGISSVNLNTSSFGTMVDSYESDAQIVTDSSQMMGLTTTTAFNDMALAVNGTTANMGTNVANTYTSMQTKQQSSLTSMKQQNMTAYNEMYNKSNQSLIQMRDSTSNITHQMTNAWNLMKNNIVASANQLKHDSTVHFNQLSNTIGSFYRKIQNPSSWGSAGSPNQRSGRPNKRVGRAVSSTIKHGFGGGATWSGSNTMTIASLKKKICPNGDCGTLFDGFNSTDVVNVSDFFSLLNGEYGFGGWSYHNTHYNHIKNKSDQWGMKSPTINLKGGIPTNADYKVGDFENGQPKISFSSFQSMAESIFSAIPYRFYYDSSWKGSWLGALQAGACNCVDGANALVAFASSCGFSGSTQHGTWVDPDGTTYPHVYAVINGKKMDTTGWQQRRSWSAGSPNVRTSTHSNPINNNGKTVVINVTLNGDNYGVDEIDARVEDAVKRGLREEFNDSYNIGVI